MTDPLCDLPSDLEGLSVRGDPACDRVLVTEAAAALIAALKLEHGALLFFQSGGCCDGSAPMCYARGEFRIGARDVLLGWLEACPFFIGGAQFVAWKHTQLILDVVKGRGAGFSIEAPRGVRFLTRSRVFDDAQRARLDAEPLHVGPLDAA